MTTPGTQDFDLVLESESELGPNYAVPVDTQGCCDSEYKLFFLQATESATADRYLVSWGYDNNVLTVKNMYNTAPLGSGYITAITGMQQALDEKAKVIFVSVSDYLHMYGYDSSGTCRWMARRIENLGRDSGQAICDPEYRVVISVRNSSNYAVVWTYNATTPSVTWRARSTIVTSVNHYPVIDRMRHIYFVGNSGVSPIQSYGYSYSGLGGLTATIDTTADIALDSNLLCDETYRYLFFIDGANNRLNILSYNEDGTFGANTQIVLAHAVASPIVLDPIFKLLFVKSSATPYPFYVYKYRADKTISLFATGVGDALNHRFNGAIDSSNNVIFSTDFFNVVRDVGLYRFYREYTRDYVASAVPSKGRAPLRTRFSSKAVESWKSYGEIYE